jgi:hypothetical protein
MDSVAQGRLEPLKWKEMYIDWIVEQKLRVPKRNEYARAQLAAWYGDRSLQRHASTIQPDNNA